MRADVATLCFAISLGPAHKITHQAERRGRLGAGVAASHCARA